MMAFPRDDAWPVSRIDGGVPKVWLLSLAFLSAVPIAADAQPWAEAYQAGEYAKAVELLQPIVTAQQSTPSRLSS